jgi:hypothetical protein
MSTAAITAPAAATHPATTQATANPWKNAVEAASWSAAPSAPPSLPAASNAAPTDRRAVETTPSGTSAASAELSRLPYSEAGAPAGRAVVSVAAQRRARGSGPGRA